VVMASRNREEGELEWCIRQSMVLVITQWSRPDGRIRSKAALHDAPADPGTRTAEDIVRWRRH